MTPRQLAPLLALALLIAAQASPPTPYGVIPAPPSPSQARPSPRPSPSPVPSPSPGLSPETLPSLWQEVPAPPTLRAGSSQFRSADLTLPTDSFQQRYGVSYEKAHQALIDYQKEHAELYFRSECRKASLETPVLYTWAGGARWGIFGYTRNPDGARIPMIWHKGKAYKDFRKLPEWD